MFLKKCKHLGIRGELNLKITPKILQNFENSFQILLMLDVETFKMMNFSFFGRDVRLGDR